MTQLPAFVSFDRRSILLAAQWIGLAVIAGILLAILGPFGSYLNGGPLRLFGYWIGAMLLGLLFYGTAYRIVAISTVTGSRAWWIALIVVSMVASIPEALVTRMLAFRLWPDLARLELSPGLWFVQTATIGVVAMAVSAWSSAARGRLRMMIASHRPRLFRSRRPSAGRFWRCKWRTTTFAYIGRLVPS